MAPFKTRFNTNKEIDGELVYMGNNEACKIKGIGLVSLKLKDETVKLLRNVRHVPLLKRSLISLGMLDSIECEYKGKGEVFEVIKDSKIVLVGERVNDLYVVRGVEMLNGAYTIAKTILTEVDLWHKRLSHISSKGMEALSKQGILPEGICEQLSFCEHYVMGKTIKHSFTKA